MDSNSQGPRSDVASSPSSKAEAIESPNAALVQGPLPAVTPMVAHCCKLLRREFESGELKSGLIVGCGSGDEVVYINGSLSGVKAFGFDLQSGFSSLARQKQYVFAADATNIPLPAGHFDFAAAFHSLEHVSDAESALDEIRRVLRPKGWFYVGVPNRTRVLGYIGSSDASTWEKIAWNIKDWTYRLRGRFENRLGAHAGFAGEELVDALSRRFVGVSLITEEYLRFKYRGRLPNWLLDRLLSPGLISYSAPSHYAICRKPE